MTTTPKSVLLLAGAVLALAGCGNGGESVPAPEHPKANASAYDTVDVCNLANDDQLKAALGEATANKERRDTDALKACAIDGASGDFYVFLSVVRPKMAADEQVGFDKAAAQDAKDVDPNTFSYFDDGQAYVETSDGDLVLRASLEYYVDSGKIADGRAVVNRLTALLNEVRTKL